MNTYWLETKFEFLSLLRTPRFSVPTLALPALFYLFFGIAMPMTRGTQSMAQMILVGYAVFGALAASMWGVAVALATERNLGWLEVKRASPMRLGSYFAAKILSAMGFSLVILLILGTLATGSGRVHLSILQWFDLAICVLAAAVPLTALGLLVGSVTSANATPAVVNLIAMPMAYRIAPGGDAGIHPGVPGADRLGLAPTTPMKLKPPLLPPDSSEGWMPYLWLVYSLPFLATPVYRGGGLWDWVSILPAYAIFLAAYFRGQWVKGPALAWNMAVLCLLSIVFCRDNPGALVFFIYAASFAPELGGTRTGWLGLGAVIVVELLTVNLLGMRWQRWIAPALFTPIVGVMVLHYTQRRRLTMRLLQTQGELARMAQIAERERIARDLHDLLGHTLSVIVLKSELASRLAESDTRRGERSVSWRSATTVRAAPRAKAPV